MMTIAVSHLAPNSILIIGTVLLVVCLLSWYLAIIRYDWVIKYGPYWRGYQPGQGCPMSRFTIIIGGLILGTLGAQLILKKYLGLVTMSFFPVYSVELSLLVVGRFFDSDKEPAQSAVNPNEKGACKPEDQSGSVKDSGDLNHLTLPDSKIEIRNGQLVQKLSNGETIQVPLSEIRKVSVTSGVDGKIILLPLGLMSVGMFCLCFEARLLAWGSFLIFLILGFLSFLFIMYRILLVLTDDGDVSLKVRESRAKAEEFALAVNQWVKTG